MDSKLKAQLTRIESGEVRTACVYELVDTYYQCVIEKIDELGGDDVYDDAPFPEELLQSVEERSSGIGPALIQLINAGHHVDETDGGFNALMLAVGSGDAPMVHFLISHGADANSWPDKLSDEENFYLDDIDLHFMEECFANDKDFEYMEALHRTALVLVEDAHLGPYIGHCLKIDESGNVSLSPARVKY